MSFKNINGRTAQGQRHCTMIWDRCHRRSVTDCRHAISRWWHRVCSCSHRCCRRQLTLSPLSHRKKYFKFFFRKWALFTLEINFRKPTSTTPMDDALDASFNVCKHWPTDQSESSISKISSATFRKLKHVLNCEIHFQNLVLSKADCSH